MGALQFDLLEVGDDLPVLNFGEITRHTLALYCGGSGDHNPIHVDSDFAKAAGYKDVFAHGMLSMAVLGRLLTQWTMQENIKNFSVRFMTITHVHDRVTASATILEKKIFNGEQTLVLEVRMTTDDGTITLLGTADIIVPIEELS